MLNSDDDNNNNNNDNNYNNNNNTIKKGMVEDIKRVSERANVTETQKISMLGSARILRKVLNVWSEWMTYVSDALGTWYAPGWWTKRHQQRLW